MKQKKGDKTSESSARPKSSSELHEEKKGTVGPFTQIKDSFNAPAEEERVGRSHAVRRPFR